MNKNNCLIISYIIENGQHTTQKPTLLDRELNTLNKQGWVCVDYTTRYEYIAKIGDKTYAIYEHSINSEDDTLLELIEAGLK